MLGRTHLLFGIFLATFYTQPFLWIVMLISSILPDVDTSTSLLGRKMKIVGKVFEHRGFFHSLFFIMPASIIIYSLDPNVGVVFTLGVGSHLVLDMITKQGLQIYPFKKKIKGPVRVGGFLEKLFAFFLFLLIILRLTHLL